jgi:hypothetical protein
LSSSSSDLARSLQICEVIRRFPQFSCR